MTSYALAEVDAIVLDPGDERASSGRGVRFNPEINLGHILTALMMTGGLMGYWMLSQNRVDQAVNANAMLQDRFSREISSLQGSMNDLRSTAQSGFTDIRAQIANLPDFQASLKQQERRISELESRLNAQDNRLGVIDRTAIETRADVNTLMRQANAPLPGKR